MNDWRTMKDFFEPDVLFPALLVLLVIVGLGFVLRPDVPGRDVSTHESSNGWECKLVIPFAEDHTLAICETRDECNLICEGK